MKTVHYLNQFFAGLGGEEAAETPPTRLDGPVGPGRGLAALAESTGVPAVSTGTYGPDRVAAAETAAALWAAAAIPDVTGLYADRPYRPLDLDLAAPVSRRPG